MLTEPPYLVFGLRACSFRLFFGRALGRLCAPTGLSPAIFAALHVVVFNTVVAGDHVHCSGSFDIRQLPIQKSMRCVSVYKKRDRPRVFSRRGVYAPGCFRVCAKDCPSPFELAGGVCLTEKLFSPPLGEFEGDYAIYVLLSRCDDIGKDNLRR